MTIRIPDPAAPFFDVADPAFSVSSAEVRRAREAGWYARTSYGLAVLRTGDAVDEFGPGLRGLRGGPGR